MQQSRADKGDSQAVKQPRGSAPALESEYEEQSQRNVLGEIRVDARAALELRIVAVADGNTRFATRSNHAKTKEDKQQPEHGHVR